MVLYLLLQSEIPGPEGNTAVLLNANHAIRTVDAMYHSATRDAQLVL